ncbi:MAG: hypothetical protein DCC55_20100 [Chloroflexi bacterium]|nr:MAG: hypothetical protein DCC55_20100 [Chloroflexota bacterium]
MTSKAPYQRIYLLIVWKERGEQTRQEIWRFRLEDSRTGYTRGFANAADLVNALLRGLEPEEDSPADPE